MDVGRTSEIVDKRDVIDAVSERHHDVAEVLAALSVLTPPPWGGHRLAGLRLEEFDRLAWIPRLAVSLFQEGFVIE
jgi:hypothetical protein